MSKKMQGAAKWAKRMLTRKGDGWAMREGEESGTVALATSKEATTHITLERGAKGWKANGHKTIPYPAQMLERFGVTKREAERIEDESVAGDILSTFIMSTETPDRTSFSVKTAGWQLDNYRSNPVLLFAHNGNAPPVGQAESVFVGMGAPISGNVRDVAPQLRGVFRFVRAETYEFGATIGRLVRDRFLRAGSVGFDPIEVAVAEERIQDKTDPFELMFPPLDFIAQELLEHSVVPIPANPEALDVTGRGIDARDLDQLREWAVQVLDEGGALVVPRSTLVTIARAGTPARLSVDMFGGNMTTRLVTRQTDEDKKKKAEEKERRRGAHEEEDDEQTRGAHEEEDDEQTRGAHEDDQDSEHEDDDPVSMGSHEDTPEEITNPDAVPGDNTEAPATEQPEPELPADPIDLPEKPTMEQLDALGGRCPSCSHEGTLSVFQIPEEEDEVRSMSTDTLMRELRRRGAPDVDDDTELFHMTEDEMAQHVRGEVADTLRTLQGKLPQ